MAISDDDDDALEAQRDLFSAKMDRGELFRRPVSPKKFESSQPFPSSPAPFGNPFLLEDESEDILEKTNVSLAAEPHDLQSQSIRSAPGEREFDYIGTVQARTSHGQHLRIARRKRRIGTTKFESEIDLEHASRTKHYGIQIHGLLSDVAMLDTEEAVEASLPVVVEDGKGPETGMWVDKYRPKKFTELLGDERTNRDVLRWIKHWDYCVFGRTNHGKNKKHKRDDIDQSTTEAIVDPHGRPEKKILMLTGPPGFGKTTLAHIAARQAGYNVIEVNASDDRTGAVVQNKIGDALESQAVFNPRPSLVVIDEIDGVSGSGGEAGFIRSLLKFIVDDEKTTAHNRIAKHNDTRAGKRKNRGSKSKALLRPIICICNDQYVPGLRALRPYCQIINFRALAAPAIVARLRGICHKEDLQADTRALNALCELAESDLRSCLNSLQYIRMKSKYFSLDSLSSTLAQRDMSRSSHSVVESVFKLLDAKQERKKGKAAVKSDNIGRIADLAMTNNEYGKILMGCFAHYPSAPYHDNLFAKPIEASDWLYFYDRCERGVYESQHGELMTYMPYPIAAFHHMFATHECKSSLDRSRADWESREKLRINSELLAGWITRVKPSIRQLFNPTMFATELIAYGLRIIGTNLNPANSHLIKSAERLALSRIVDGMLSLGLSYTQFKVDDGSYIFRLEPPITQVLNYGGALTVKGESLLPSRYAARQIISAELAAEKIRRALETQGDIIQPSGRPNGSEKSSTIPTKRKAQEELLAQPAVKRDFFGRTIVLRRDDTTESTGSSKVPDKPKAGVHIKFSDGFSDAVRNNISLQELLKR